jgi:non-heme chloroperoxidase
MKWVLLVLVVIVVIPVIAAAAILLLDSPVPPKPLASIEHAFDGVDFSNLPKPQTYTARDGTQLRYLAYPGRGPATVVLIHGSSGWAANMHVLAEALQRRGANVYALSMRGHDGTGRPGDIDYVGQLDDDLADFIKTLPAKKVGETRTLLGFSSGGGFVLRVAGGPDGKLFDRFVFVSPDLPYNAPTIRVADAKDGSEVAVWAVPAIPRIIVLTTLSRFGIHAFGGLPVLAFAVAPEYRNVQTAFYSFRMLQNFGATQDYKQDLKRAPGSVALFVGGNDELFYPDRFAPLLKPARPDLTVRIIPGMGHMDMTVKSAAVEEIAASVMAPPH